MGSRYGGLKVSASGFPFRTAPAIPITTLPTVSEKPMSGMVTALNWLLILN